jgi:DNA-binding LytR/AlgR family response regulator
MNCIIVDDEPQARKLLQTYLSDIPGLQLVKICRNAMEAYEVLQTGEVDLMFLDIRMPVVTGIDFIRSLKFPPLVIFTTAYDQYAIQGYELDVVDYLLKPVSLSRLLQAVEKAKARVSAVKHSERTQEEHLFVKQDNRLVKIVFSEILYVESMQNYIKLMMKNRELIISSTTKAFEEQLPAQQFVRIHRSYIVSLAAITAVRPGQVELGEVVLPIGNSYRENLLSLLGQ